jgi:hypothetical protein
MESEMAADKGELRALWSSLERLEGTDPANRGFQLESLVFRLALLEGLDCRPSYRSVGEQIDGLVEVDGRHILIETRWVAEAVPASDVYAFRAKVEGRLVGTIGLFIAVNGFSETVPDVLRYGKEINVVLMDGEDVRMALQDGYNLKEIIKVKLRRAAQYGEVLYTFKRFLDEQSA